MTDNTIALESLEWQKQDTVWMLSLYGTAIGAGILFLPIDAGLHGIIPLVMMVLLSFPITYFSHRALCRFVLSGSAKNNITEVVDEHFGSFSGKVITLLYFFAIYPILLMYSVAITNTTHSFLVHQLKVNAPPRALLAFILVFGLMVVVRLGQKVVVRFISYLVYPFVAVLMCLSVYLIPYWNVATLQHHSVSNNNNSLFMTLWLLLPVMVFSFNHSPIISSFAVNQKQRYGERADKKSSTILRNCHILMVATVMFFVLSCVLSLSPNDLQQAKEQNISILSYLANHFETPLFAYIAPIVAFVAIAKSFFGHYLGAAEGLRGLIAKRLEHPQPRIDNKNIGIIIDIFIIVTCWLVATLNPNILRIIETLGGPIIALILFLLPMYAILRVPAMKKYAHSRLINLFTTLIGFIAISAIVYNLF